MLGRQPNIEKERMRKLFSTCFSIIFVFSALNAGRIPPLTYDESGIPRQVPIQEALEKSNKLEAPTSIQGKLKYNSINEETDIFLQRSWENARKAQEKAEGSQNVYNNWLDKGWEYFKEISSLGLLNTKVDEVEKLHRETREHYIKALQSSRLTYEEVISDMYSQKIKLEKIGADNYTGPAHQSHKKVKETLNRLDKEKIEEEIFQEKGKDIATIMTKLSKEIKTAEMINPEIFNLITNPRNSLITEYSELKKEIDKDIQRMNKTKRKQKEKHERLIKKLEKRLTDLEKEKIEKVRSNPSTGRKGEITHTEISGNPAEQYRQIESIKSKSERKAAEARRIYRNEEYNYLSRNIKIYKMTINNLQKSLETTEELEKTLKNIEKHYKEKINKRKSEIEESILTRYREKIKDKEEYAKEQETIGERIKKLEETLEYIETVKELEKEDLTPIKRRIENTINRVEKYIELGYPLEDKLEKLEKLKQVNDPEMLPKTQKTLNELKKTIEIRTSPLENEIREKREKTDRIIESMNKITKTAYGEIEISDKIDEKRLKELENQYRKLKSFDPLKNPIRKLEGYRSIIREISPVINSFKEEILLENTEIKLNEEKETLKCNQEIITEIQIEIQNTLPITLYNTKIEKEIPGKLKLRQQPEKENLHLDINEINPHETVIKTKKAKMTPYTCEEKRKETISINEETKTEQKEIKIIRNVKDPELFLDSRVPEKGKIINKPPNARVENGKIKIKAHEEEQEIQITYRKNPEIEIIEEKNWRGKETIDHQIEIINHEEKIQNFTIKRNIDPSKIIECNYPIKNIEEYTETDKKEILNQKQDLASIERTEIRIPELKNHAEIEITYLGGEPKEEAQKAMNEIYFLKDTRKIPEGIESQIESIERLFELEKYQKVTEEAPKIINELKKQPIKGIEREIEEKEETEAINETHQEEKIEEENKSETYEPNIDEIRKLKEKTSVICRLIECGEIKQKLDNLDQYSDIEKEKIKSLRDKISSKESKAESKMKENSEEIEKIFKSLEKAFEIEPDLEIDKKHIPYTKEDFNSLKNRRENLENEKSSLVLDSFDKRIEENNPEELKNEIKKREELIKDSKDLLSQMEKSSVERLKEAKNKYQEKGEKAPGSLEKAKESHEKGKYLESIAYSERSIEKVPSKDSGFPYKYLVGLIMIIGTSLYVIKKPGKDKEDEEDPVMLKRGK